MRNKTRSCEASSQKHPLGKFRPENLYWRGPAIYPCSWPLGTFRQVESLLGKRPAISPSSSPLGTFRQESLCWQNVSNSEGQEEVAIFAGYCEAEQRESLTSREVGSLRK